MTETQIYAMIKTHNRRALNIARAGKFWWKLSLFTIVIVGLFFYGGRGVGEIVKMKIKRERKQIEASLASAMLPEVMLAQLAELEKITDDTPAARLTLAMAYQKIADSLPARKLYLQKAATEYEYILAQNLNLKIADDERESSVSDFNQTLSLAAGWNLCQIKWALGQDAAALARLKNLINEMSTGKPNEEYMNLLAGIYATAKSPEIRNPQLALTLALKNVPDWQTCDVAYRLDNLAMAYMANGQTARATQVAKRAWGLARRPEDLWRIQENYAKIISGEQ